MQYTYLESQIELWTCWVREKITSFLVPAILDGVYGVCIHARRVHTWRSDGDVLALLYEHYLQPPRASYTFSVGADLPSVVSSVSRRSLDSRHDLFSFPTYISCSLSLELHCCSETSGDWLKQIREAKGILDKLLGSSLPANSFHRWMILAFISTTYVSVENINIECTGPNCSFSSRGTMRPYLHVISKLLARVMPWWKKGVNSQTRSRTMFFRHLKVRIFASVSKMTLWGAGATQD